MPIARTIFLLSEGEAPGPPRAPSELNTGVSAARGDPVKAQDPGLFRVDNTGNIFLSEIEWYYLQSLLSL